MKAEFYEYMANIGLTKVLQDRVKEIYETYLVLSPEEITDIFITDRIRDDGNRVYENLWFFSESYMMEAKGFVSSDNLDIAPMLGRIKYLNLRKHDYDFKKANEASRMYLLATLVNDLGCEWVASKENCDYLRDIMLNRLMPNLKR